MQAHGILASKHPMLVNARMPSPKHGSVGEAGASSPVPLLRMARKTHRELHEEVFALVNVSVELPSNKPLGEVKARRPISSRTTNARPALPQAASAVPPVPPLPSSKRLSLRILSHHAEARDSGSSTPPSQPTDHRTFSHGMKNTHLLSTRSDESIAHSNSLTSLNSSTRRDHSHSKQGFRPRDSLILEKARHFDHLHTLRMFFSSWLYCTLTFYAQRTMDVRHLWSIPPTFRYHQYHNLLIFRIYKNWSIQDILLRDPPFNFSSSLRGMIFLRCVVPGI